MTGAAVPRLSAVVITKNEAANLPRCLESVRGVADEIVVVDSGSTDETEAIARRFTDRVLTQAWLGYGPQKQFAVEQATSPWVFSIDADEEVSPELAAELSDLDDRVAGYFVPRRVRYMGRWLEHGVWNPDFVLRAFRRDRGRFTRDRVHESVRVEGPTRRLHGVLRHYSFRDLAHHVQKMNEMTSLAAEQMAERGRSAGWAHLSLVPAWEFVRAYLLKRGFADGLPGLAVAALHAHYVFLKHAKLHERERTGKRS